MTFHIVIPVLNEEDRLESGITALLGYLEASMLKDKTYITIADNGSTDRTEEIARRLCEQYAQIRYKKLGQRGVGLAFRTCIQENTDDIIGYMDVDLATDLQHLEQVYKQFEAGANIVVGSRLLRGSKVIGRTLKREITSRGLNFLLKLLLRVRFSDAMCGFKFYKRDIALQLTKLCSENNGWFYCAEMMIRAEWLGYRITEIPVTWRDDPEGTKVKVGKLSMSYLSEIRKLCRERNRQK